MTELEFSNEMDVIYENINKGGAVGLDAYEKSVILTMAAEKVGVELIKADLGSVPQLVHTEELSPIAVIDPAELAVQIDARSKVFELPGNYVSILTESALEGSDKTFVVLPIMPIEYQRLMAKPYNYPTKRTSWRLVNSNAGETGTPGSTTATKQAVEIIGPNSSNIDKYKVTMTVLPEPIIVEDLPDPLTIRGKDEKQNTNLSTAYHPTILEYATTLAERYYFDKYGNPGQQQQ